MLYLRQKDGVDTPNTTPWHVSTGLVLGLHQGFRELKGDVTDENFEKENPNNKLCCQIAFEIE